MTISLCGQPGFSPARSHSKLNPTLPTPTAAHHVVVVEQWLTGDEEGEGDHGGRDKPAAHGFSHQGGTAGDAEFGGRCQNALTHRARLHACGEVTVLTHARRETNRLEPL
ncbi:TPA: hypothetical protein NIF88_004068 [Pseudomonas aeruginosa]|nr:hypothetical protein [Pseudomonas aeruginosa]